MEAVAAAHRAAWDYAMKNEERWIHSFMAERALDRKLGILIAREAFMLAVGPFYVRRVG